MRCAGVASPTRSADMADSCGSIEVVSDAGRTRSPRRQGKKGTRPMTAFAEPSKSQPTSIKIRRLGVFLGAEITGVDLTGPLESATVEALKRAHAEHGVLVFPDQVISSEDLK